jgi:hypothetical protein
MKKYLILTIVTLALSALGQANTNLAPQLNTVFLSLNPAVQASTLAAFADYNRAVARSPEFKGVLTNTVVTIITDTNGVPTVTNSVSTVTTNHPTMSITLFFQAALAQEKVSRIVEQRNQELIAEMYRKVGETVVNSWP